MGVDRGAGVDAVGEGRAAVAVAGVVLARRTRGTTMAATARSVFNGGILISY